MAGGSTDCAAFIQCINKLFSLNLSLKQMMELGVKLGADVPQAFYKRPIIARGIGDVIEEIDTKFKYYIVIVKPSFSCNTKEMFKRLDSICGINQVYNSEAVKNAINSKDIRKLSKNLYNVFENGIEGLKEIKEEIINQGAMSSIMTGSGACVYGVFEDKIKAKNAFKILSRNFETYFSIAI